MPVHAMQILAAEFERYVAAGFGTLHYDSGVDDPDTLHELTHGGDRRPSCMHAMGPSSPSLACMRCARRTRPIVCLAIPPSRPTRYGAVTCTCTCPTG